MVSIPFLGEWAKPFLSDPNFNTPQAQEGSNFIERGISSGIEKGLGSVGDKIINAGKIKTQSFAENLPELASIALISYLIYLGYLSFIKNGKGVDVEEIFSKIYPSLMIYIVFKLFWKVILKI